MSSNAVFFFGVLIFIFILWIVTGGPSKPISFSGPYLHPITGPGQDAEPYSLGRGSGSSYTGGNGSSLLDLEKQLGDLSSFGEASSYRGIVTFNRNPSGPRGTHPETEYVRLEVSRRAKDSVNMTGWKLESASTGITAVIPNGVVVPRSGQVNQVTSITVAPGETVVVTSGRSPIGTSFRENLCTGYLAEFQEFSPELEAVCPTAQEEFSRRYHEQDDRECASYMWQVPRCSVVSRAPEELSNSCEDFVESLNYNSCVAEYASDPEFAGSTWRVFIGSNQELWRENHETIRLIDGEGKTVDVLAY